MDKDDMKLETRDVETGEDFVQDKLSQTSKLIQTLEAAALLTIWSLLVINEGAIRLINTNPSVDLTASGRPSNLLLFLAGLFEVFFGLLGLGLGVAAFIPRWYSTTITKLSMIIQTMMGYYVFAIYVFVVPAFRAADLEAPVLEGLTIGTSRLLIAMGVLTSFHFCLALQGGQFVFMARLVCAATGENFLMQKTGNQMRGIFWNANLAFSGLWTVITGAVVNSNVGSGRLSMPYAFAPNVGTLPGLTIFTGLLMLVWGIVGIAVTVSKLAPDFYFAGSGIVFLFAFLNFGIAQFSTFDGAPAWAVAMHNGLVFMVVFMGPYFVLQNKKEAAHEQ